MKTCSTSLVIREIQINTTMKSLQIYSNGYYKKNTDKAIWMTDNWKSLTLIFWKNTNATDTLENSLKVKHIIVICPKKVNFIACKFLKKVNKYNSCNAAWSLEVLYKHVFLRHPVASQKLSYSNMKYIIHI